MLLICALYIVDDFVECTINYSLILKVGSSIYETKKLSIDTFV